MKEQSKFRRLSIDVDRWRESCSILICKYIQLKCVYLSILLSEQWMSTAPHDIPYILLVFRAMWIDSAAQIARIQIFNSKLNSQ